MIFVTYHANAWIQKHPGLKMLSLKCDNCGREIVANKPFVEKGYAGLAAEDCTCGKNHHTCVSKVTTTKDSYHRWSSLVQNYL